MAGSRHGLVASLICLLLISIIARPVFADVPKMLNYQGRMTDGDDVLIDGTTYYYQFEIYDDPSAGSLLWSSQEDFHSTCGVAITPSDGVFNIIIGDPTVNNMSDIDIDFDADPYYLLIKISATQSNNVACEGTLGAGASYESLSPRQRVVSSGFAFTSRMLSGDYDEEITNPIDDYLAFSGTGGDATDVYFDLDGTYPVVYSNTDTTVGLDDDLTFVGAQSITTSAGALTIQPAAGSNLNISLSTTGDLAVNTNQLYVDTSAGYVGIGTTGPSQKLQVAGSAIVDTALGVGITTFANNNINMVNGLRLQWQTAAGVAAGYIGGSVSATGDLQLITSNNADITLAPNGTGDTLITNGNVGIGDTGPDYPLEVLSTTTPQFAITETDGTDYATFAVDTNGDLTIDLSGGDLTLNSGDNLNLTASTDLIFGGTTSLGETTGATDSGAYMVGAFDEFANSAGQDVQTVLDDLDQLIEDLETGSAGLWRDGGTYVYPNNVGTTFQIADTTGNLTLPGTIALPNSNTLTGVTSYTQFSAGISVGGGTTYYLNSSGNLNVNNGTIGGTLTASGAGPHDIANTLNTDTLVVDTLLDVNEEIDIDLDAADEEIRIAQSALAGTEYVSGDPTGLIFINDDRTGATTDEVQEATMVFDSGGTYAIAALDGRAYFGDVMQASQVWSDADVYVNYDGADGDSNVYFYNDSTATDEYLRWDDVTGYGDGEGFLLSDDLQLEGNLRKDVASSNLTINSAGANAGIVLQTGGSDKATISANGDLTLNNSTYGYLTFGELASAPGTAAARQYYNTTDDMMYYYDGSTSSWRSMQGVTIEQFAPEYENSVIAADGSNNDGTLITGYEVVSNNTYTFYQWTTNKPTLQDYDVVLHARVPSNFVSWAANAITLNYKTGLATTADNYVSWEIYEDGNAVALMSSASMVSTSWATDSATSAELSALTAGDTFRIVVKLGAKNTLNAATYAGYLTLFYR